ncbi:MAG: hypothetical protein WC100_08675 [Sterolibacterium sp.]
MRQSLEQPLLGILATATAIAVALTVVAQFDPQILGSWVLLAVLSGLPILVVFGLVWRCGYPASLSRLSQPTKGIAILSVMTVISVIVGSVVWNVVGGKLLPPAPFTSLFAILSILVLFWFITLFQGWPLTVLSKHPAFIGVGVIAMTYLITWLVFRSCFDFGAMQGAPFYRAELDPHGVLPAFVAVSFACTVVMVIMGLVLFDFWPFSSLAKTNPSLAGQPLWGIVNTLVVFALSWAIWKFCVSALGMDVVDYMVRVPVSALFGEFIVIVMMQLSPFQSTRQPLRGIILVVMVAILALVMHRFYQFAGGILIGPMESGAPGYALELWTANAMLGVTFPVIALFGDGFGFWPLVSVPRNRL